MMQNGAQMERIIDLKTHQRVKLDILLDFSSFCDKNALECFLDAGTLLGAIRHQGFIPWDNDVDVCMMRDDYDRLSKILIAILPISILIFRGFFKIQYNSIFAFV